MRHRGVFTAALMLLLLASQAAHAQGQRETAAADRADEETARGRSIVIEVPPSGLQMRLALDPGDHTVLNFDTPIDILVDNLEGATTRKVSSHRVDIWPHKAARLAGDPPLPHVSLGGNLSVESLGRTVVFQVFEPDDLDQTVDVARVRPISQELIDVRRQVSEAKDEVARAEAARRVARQEASDAARAREAAEAAEAKANQEAEKARVQARASRAWARREVAKANAETAKATKDAEEARAAAAKAEAEAEAARAEAAAAREREKKAVEAARRQAEAAELTLHQSLVAEARDIGGDQVQRLIPDQEAKYVRQGRVHVEYRSGDWKHGYFIVDTRVQAEPGRPVVLAGAQATTKGGRALETRVVHPSAPENPVDGVITTVRPGTPERITFAVKVPPDVQPHDLTLTLTQQGSQSPLNFLVPSYNDAAVALLLPVSDAEEQRRRWATHIVAGPRFALGGCSLTSGIAGDEDVEFTRCMSIGAFAMKGLHDVGLGSLFAVGAEATYEWSDAARFDREPADIMRKAAIVRLVTYGDVRLSREKWVPYVRLGAGLQATTYKGADTDIAVIFAGGGGLEYRFGDQFSVAIGGGYISASPLAVSVDVRLGYRWGAKPRRGTPRPPPY